MPSISRKLRRQLTDIATGIEVTELPGDMHAVDFCLYSLTDYERRGQQDNASEAGLEAGRDVLDGEGYATKADGEQITVDELRSSDFEGEPTQRSGGGFKSSIVIEDGSVAEFNFRYPPLDGANPGELITMRRLKQVMRAARRPRPADTFAPSCLVRPNIPAELKEDISEMAGDVDGSAYGEDELCPHIRAEKCEQPPERIVSYLERTIKEYDREFDHEREWATEAEQGRDVQGEQGDIDEARACLETIAPGSRIDASGGQVEGYRITLPPYPADEYGLILLRRAVDHVTDKHGLLPESEREVTETDGAYTVECHGSECSRPVSDIVEDVGTLLSHGETIDKRSRLA